MKSTLKFLCHLAIATTLFADSLAIAANDSVPRLTRTQIDRVEAGQGNPAEEAEYILICFEDPACYEAMLSVWKAKGESTPYPRYAPPPERIPAIVRGTELGQKLQSIGALNACNRDTPCRSFLVDVVKALRMLSPQDLRAAQGGQSATEQQRRFEADAAQMERNLANSISRANTASMPAAITSVDASISTKPAGANETGRASLATGSVIDYARDPWAKVTIQLVASSSGNREIQRRSSDGTATLATVAGREGKWLIEFPNSDAAIDAIDIQLTSRGFVAGTRSRMISFTPGAGLTNLQMPQEFHVAPFQRGDVALSGYLLLERNGVERNSLSGVANALSDIGNLLNATRREDYILLDLHTGKTFPLNVSSNGKNVTELYNCRARNALLNVCNDARTKEQLYSSIGKNIRHYAWSIYWFRAPAGSYLIALEDGMRNVTVTKLDTGEKRVAFNRSLGLNDVSAAQDDDGRVRLSASGGFNTERIDDLEAKFNSLPAYEASSNGASSSK